MSKLTKPIIFQTAFAEYQVDTVLGEGGAGRVYGGRDADGDEVALKLLTQSATDKRRRFKNEIAFLAKARHPRLVPVIDYGLSSTKSVEGPFYVMPRYDGSLRGLMRQGLAPERVLPLFIQVLDGVEAAHFLGATHRDLKPENVLTKNLGTEMSVADFGVASFTADAIETLVETGPAQRLANFQYAAPEQRVPGRKVTVAADIYALGLMLNEMYTGSVPHGTSYQLIASSQPEFGYLDALVAEMIAQTPDHRPMSIAAIKGHIQKYSLEFVRLQRLSQINLVVIPEGEVDEPLAHQPPTLVDADWDNGTLTLTLDRPVNTEWAQILNYRLESYGAVLGAGPEAFRFSGKIVKVSVPEHSAQSAINHFKQWLPQATNIYRHSLEADALRQELARREKLDRERAAEEQRLRVNRSLRI